MEKLADTSLPIHDLLRRRWSPRSFLAQSLYPATLELLLEAARWAPSANNEQPWRFLYAYREETERFERMLSCLAAPNIVWARNAALLMFPLAQLTFTRNGNPNRHAFYDVGQAVANLSLQATAIGVGVHQMAGFDPAKVRQLFNVPENMDAVVGLAIGYPGEPNALPPPYNEREIAPRQRKPVGELIFREPCRS